MVSFAEKIAIFDARTFEDRLTITTCYPSPGLSSNPIALGSRWLAYAEKKLIPSKRSAGGCDCDGVSSYTATVLNAAKTLGKGLRELGEQVAAGLTGTATTSTSFVNLATNTAVGNEAQQMNPGIVTILDIKVSLHRIASHHDESDILFSSFFLPISPSHSIQSKKLVQLERQLQHQGMIHTLHILLHTLML